MSVILQCAPIDEPVYQFMDKKRSEGKPYRVYMMASANKFLRIYYASVKGLLGIPGARLIFTLYTIWLGRRFNFEMLSGLILYCIFSPP